MIVALRLQCLKCGELCPYDDFYAQSGGRGIHSHCKACKVRYGQAARERYAARKGEGHIPGRKRCPGCERTLEARDFYRKKTAPDGLCGYCKICDGVRRRSALYGLARHRAAEMLKQTHCEACRRPLADPGARHFDHRHSDGAVRGVLCAPCNFVVGACEESVDVLAGIQDYLRRTAGVDYRNQPYLKQKCMFLDNSPPDQHPPQGLGSTCQTNTPSQ